MPVIHAVPVSSGRILPALPGWRLSNWNPMFPGSHDMLVQQNEELDRTQLPRIFDDYELMR